MTDEEKIVTTGCIRNFSEHFFPCLDKQGEIIIFGPILTTFELSRIFGGSLGSIENWLIGSSLKPNRHREI